MGKEALQAWGIAQARPGSAEVNMFASAEAASWLDYGWMCHAPLTQRLATHGQYANHSVPGERWEGVVQPMPLRQSMPFNTSRLEEDLCIHGLCFCGPLKDGVSNGMPPACNMQGSHALHTESQRVKGIQAACTGPALHHTPGCQHGEQLQHMLPRGRCRREVQHAGHLAQAELQVGLQDLVQAQLLHLQPAGHGSMQHGYIQLGNHLEHLLHMQSSQACHASGLEPRQGLHAEWL